MYSLRSFIFVCLFLCVIGKNVTRESIGFPEQEEDINLSNKDNRQPVYIPARCPENELFYPGDQKDDWICDCRPAFVYHPKTDLCWPAYRKGPCENGYYLILPQDSVIPVCQKNPCTNDGYVLYNRQCQQLGSIAPCRNLWPVAALAINSTNLSVTCETVNLESRFGENQQATVQCLLGGKRLVNGKCDTPSP